MTFRTQRWRMFSPNSSIISLWLKLLLVYCLPDAFWLVLDENNLITTPIHENVNKQVLLYIETCKYNLSKKVKVDILSKDIDNNSLDIKQAPNLNSTSSPVFQLYTKISPFSRSIARSMCSWRNCPSSRHPKRHHLPSPPKLQWSPLWPPILLIFIRATPSTIWICQS